MTTGESVTIRRAKSKKDLDGYWRLRFRVYCQEKRLELGGLNPEEYPDGREIDAWDAHSEVFVGVNQAGCVVSGVRLIQNSPLLGFRMEEHTKNLDYLLACRGIHRSQVVQAGRMVTAAPYRDAGLMERVCNAGRLWSLRHGYKFWILDPQASLVPVLEALGWHIECLSQEPVTFRKMQLIPLLRYLNHVKPPHTVVNAQNEEPDK